PAYPVSAHISVLSLFSSALLFFKGSCPHRPLLSFPTRRSSDLLGESFRRRRSGGGAAAGEDGPGQRSGGGRRGAGGRRQIVALRSEEHTSELQSLTNLVCRLLLEKKKTERINH